MEFKRINIDVVFSPREMQSVRKLSAQLALATGYNGDISKEEVIRMRKQAQEILALLENLEAKVVLS